MIEKILQKNEEVINYIYFFTKLILVALSSFLAFKIKINELYFKEYAILTILLIGIMILFDVTFYKKNRFYNNKLSNYFTVDLSHFFISLLILIFIGAVLKVTGFYSRLWLLMLIIFNCIFLLLNKIIFNYFYQSIITSNVLTKNILLIGKFAECKKLLQSFAGDNKFHFRACIFLGDVSESKYFPIQQIKLDKNISKNINFYRISQIWILSNDKINRNDILTKLSTIPIDIRTIHENDFHKDHYLENLNGYTIYETSLSPFYGFNYLIKSFIDYLFGILFLVLSIPVLIIFGFLIFLEDGRPIFFVQKRHGWDGSIIKIYKLRSLKLGSSTDQVIKNDNRVLKIGRIIRRFSIDELPQFINIIKGDMSLVGPRPHLIDHNDEFSKQIKGFMQRHRCKPGLTGLAQVNGFRGNIENKNQIYRRYEYDMLYIKKWSPFLDIFIIFKTMFIFLFQSAH